MYDQPSSGSSSSGSDRPTVVVASAEPLRLRTSRVEHPSIPEGALGLGTYVEGKLIGRQPITPESVDAYRALLAVPRRLVYVAFEQDDGSVEGQLSAMIPPSEAARFQRRQKEEDEEEPWKASVPSFEAKMAEQQGEAADDADEIDDTEQVALLPLGKVVRLAARRTRPDLAAEAADVLRSVVREGTLEIVDQFLDTI